MLHIGFLFFPQGTAEEVASLRRCSAIVAYVGKDQEDQQIFTKTGTMQVCASAILFWLPFF